MPGVIVTEHAYPHAAQVRSAADWIDERIAPQHSGGFVFATELRAAADYIEFLEGRMAKRTGITANRGASLNRQSVVARLRRDRSKATADVREYINGFLEWISGQSIRAAKKNGGLGKRA